MHLQVADSIPAQVSGFHQCLLCLCACELARMCCSVTTDPPHFSPETTSLPPSGTSAWMQRIFSNPSSSPLFHVLLVHTQFLACVDPAWRPSPSFSPPSQLTAVLFSSLSLKTKTNLTTDCCLETARRDFLIGASPDSLFFFFLLEKSITRASNAAFTPVFFTCALCLAAAQLLQAGVQQEENQVAVGARRDGGDERLAAVLAQTAARQPAGQRGHAALLPLHHGVSFSPPSPRTLSLSLSLPLVACMFCCAQIEKANTSCCCSFLPPLFLF